MERILSPKLCRDLGSAGHDGFRGNNSLWQVRFVNGDHHAALAEEHWNDIADFILDEPPSVPKSNAKSQKPWVTIPSLFPPLIWGTIASVILWGASIIYRRSSNHTLRTAGLILYSKLVWDILSRM
jgi:hypothetical protein